MNRAELIDKLSKQDLMVDGHRNDDAVNLAIIAYDDACGEIGDEHELFEEILKLVDKEPKLPDRNVPSFDEDYLMDKCLVLIGYLPVWYDTGDIYSYAII